MEKDHGGSFSCEVCDFTASDVKSLKKHIEDEHSCQKCRKPKGKKLALDCKTCKMPTHYDCLKTDIGKERAESYKLRKTVFQCKSCLEKSIGIDINPPQSEAEFLCEKCEYKHQNETEFEQHKKTHEENMVLCDICRQQFKTDDDLHEHMNSHAGPSSLSCTHRKAFRTIRCGEWIGGIM